MQSVAGIDVAEGEAGGGERDGRVFGRRHGVVRRCRRIIHRRDVDGHSGGSAEEGSVADLETEGRVGRAVAVQCRSEHEGAEAGHRDHLVERDGDSAERQRADAGECGDLHALHRVADIAVAEREVGRRERDGRFFGSCHRVVRRRRRVAHGCNVDPDRIAVAHRSAGTGVALIVRRDLEAGRAEVICGGEKAQAGECGVDVRQRTGEGHRGVGRAVADGEGQPAGSRQRDCAIGAGQRDLQRGGAGIHVGDRNQIAVADGEDAGDVFVGGLRGRDGIDRGVVDVDRRASQVGDAGRPRGTDQCGHGGGLVDGVDVIAGVRVERAV